MTGLLKHPRQQNEALGRNSSHSFAAKHAQVHYQSGAIYTMIPKNGCTTLRFALARANNCIADESDWTWIHPNNSTFSAELRDLVLAPYSFVVLRCPYARLASVFLNKIVEKESDFWNLYRKTGDSFDTDRITFRDFVDILSKPTMRRLNVHWRPQVDFLVYDTYSAYFQLEHFGAAIPEIETRTGITITDTRHLAGHGTDGYTSLTDGCFADTSRVELEQMKRDGQLPAHAAMYDRKLVKAVAKLYADDIDFYTHTFGAGDLLFP